MARELVMCTVVAHTIFILYVCEAVSLIVSLLSEKYRTISIMDYIRGEYDRITPNNNTIYFLSTINLIIEIYKLYVFFRLLFVVFLYDITKSDTVRNWIGNIV